MALEADIVTYLDAQTALTSGTDLFEGPLPEGADPSGAPTVQVGVVHYASVHSDDYTMGPSLTPPGSELEAFQVMTRGAVASKAAAKAQADAIHALLDNAQGLVINGRTYFAIDSDGPPYLLSQDNNLRWRYVASYHARKQRG